tara:strand:- start:228 stop:1943 length:1716 start_codon:yes stop_codon:yes gene_type:complete
MASTIQLKTGTGSAVPSSLTQGELAINIDNGLFYYGSGSTNTTKQLESFTHITASGNISASGTIIADAITATLAAGTDNSVVVLNSSNQLVTDEARSEIFGTSPLVTTATLVENFNTATDETPAGKSIEATNVTAVSTSDNAEFFVGVLDGASGTQAVETSARLKYNPNSGKLDVSGEIVASGPLSSSNNLIIEGSITGSSMSASGQITAQGIKIGDARLAFINNANTIIGSTDQVDLAGALPYVFTPNVFIKSHITASGNISASGDITASGFLGDGSGLTNVTAAAPAGTYSSSLQTLGNITSSGNISSSSDIIANRLILDQGDQSNPSLIFGTDTDTGIFRAGNDILSFQVGGGNVEMSLLGSTNTLSTNSHLSVGSAALTRHVTASGNISASGHISASNNGAGFVVRPNLYWFATNTSETVAANSNDGAFPATDTTRVEWTEEVCSNQEVFVFGSNTLRIDRAGLYKFTYNVTLGINNGSNRTEGGVAIIKDPLGSPSVVDGSVTSTYNRFVEGGGLASRGTACATVVIDVATNDVFSIDFAKICDTTDATKLKTLPEGTSWYVEALT